MRFHISIDAVVSGLIATVRAVSPTSGDRLYLTLRQTPGNQVTIPLQHV